MRSAWWLVVGICSSCGLAKLDPEQVAAKVRIQPTAFDLLPQLATGQLLIRATLQACNDNDMALTLREASWVARLHASELGHGVVLGPVRVEGGQCGNLAVEGTVSAAEAGGALLAAMLGGRPATRELWVDATAEVYGLTFRRQVRLDRLARPPRAAESPRTAPTTAPH